jgi:acyl carrier protein
MSKEWGPISYQSEGIYIMRDNIKDEVINIISNIAKIPKEQVDIAVPYAELNIDSFALLEIIFAIEIKYNITFPQDKLPAIATIEDLIKLTRQMAKKHG